MSEFHNCNFKVGDIIIGINPDRKFTYLRIFIIKGFDTHSEYGREFVDYANVEFITDDSMYKDIHNYEIHIKSLNNDFRRIDVEEV